MKRNFISGILLVICGAAILILLHGVLHASAWMLDFVGWIALGFGAIVVITAIVQKRRSQYLWRW